MSGSLHELRRRVVNAPDDADARVALAEALAADHRHADAAAQLEKALSFCATHGYARRLLLHAYLAEGRNVPAERLLVEAVALHPKEAAWRDELAKILLGIGRKDDALLQLEEAERADPNNRDRLYAMARLHLEQRRPERARPLLTAARRLSPQSVDAAAIEEAYQDTLLLLGDVSALISSPLTQGREFLIGRARQVLKEPFWQEAMGGSYRAVLDSLASLDVQAAKRALIAVATAAPLVTAFLKAELLLLEGEWEKAERSFASAAAAFPKVALLWKRLAELRQHGGALAEALKCYQTALKLVPKDAEVLERMGDLHTLANDPAAAQKCYQQAARLEPGGPAAAKLGAGARHGDAAEPTVGSLHALGWNHKGGVASPLEAVAIAGRGELLLSGNMGPSSQEAAHIAWSCLKARAKELGLADAVRSSDLHLHFVDTEFAKDGPSAGLAMFLAAASAFLHKPLPAAFAVTGELTIQGAVRAIGGLHEKVVAAGLAGIRTVMLPRRNLLDARDLTREALTRVQLVYVDNVSEALAHALPDSPKPRRATTP